MSYVALYRSYRPQTFSEVAGQKMIVQTLTNAIKHDKIAHAYLFSGPRGTGKTSIAKIMAKAINCPHLVDGNPCNECEICKAINKNEVSDVVEIDAASNNGVDEIRDLRDKVNYAPSVGTYKVYIIDEVHMLTTGAFNALLKTLEEPPKHVVFILATTEIHKIPATILSRCQRFDFKNIDQDDIVEKLKEIVLKEKININDQALKEIAIHSEGGMRDALSLLDQVISYKADDITEDDVLVVSGGLSKKTITTILESVVLKKPQQAINELNNILKQGKDISRVTNDLILALRDILLDRTNKTNLYEEFKLVPIQKIYAYLAILNELLQDIKWTNQKRAYIEMALIKMINHESVAKADLEAKVEYLEIELEKLKSLPKQTQIVNKQVPYQATPKGKPLVTVKQVEDILRNSNKAKKELLLSAWSRLEDYPLASLNGIAKMLYKGSLEAMTDDVMLLVYDSVILGKQMLKKEIKKQVLQILNQKKELVKDYIVILKPDWLYLKEAYLAELNSGTAVAKLPEYDLHLYEDEISEEFETKEDPTVSLAYEYFGKEKVKIKE
ncbi:DNA polymerase III, gamma and tau subunit [Alteracholeplasma palmae J233]|uniref:DNA polymerase III subunit gamma/tau n=1 Tax=Alteracholeplasma palmae (strain ATCC 49389 / J233) TaxID=1318466 RepID=U4KLV0_ALTPJ|nr:DNA polymerase III subunit gamma/tau [Alteracholeplasma palmae]CCV64989.1 DNA polymerase III, gamma and tau subunit [Alteracholeplasma palmae J233]